MTDQLAQSHAKQPARIWRLVAGALLILLAANASTKQPTQPDLASAMGVLSGMLFLIGVGVWLIATGLPRSLVSTEIRKVRRKIWLQLVGVGFVVMIVAAIGLASQSFFVAGVLVTWAFWFGWTWIAWLMADRMAIRRMTSSQPTSPHVE